MSSAVDDRSSRRRHDAAASRQALLRAAAELFDERGYDGATVRDIGERAGVDPALIARYFSCKEGLYLAALDADERPALPDDPVELLERMLAYNEERGGPIPRAMVSPALSDTARERIRNVLERRVTERLTAELERRGVTNAQLRAELLVAMSVGISLTRSGGTLAALHDASFEQLLEVLRPAAAALVGETAS
jgi:AcrR family transcriptional regulator